MIHNTYLPSQYAFLIRNKAIPSYPCDTTNAMVDMVHNLCISRGIWPMLSRTWLSIMADLCKDKVVLEVMAGGGWIASYLRSKGIGVIATDNYSYAEEGTHKYSPITRVMRMDAIEAVKKYQKRSDIKLWPTYGDTTAEMLAGMWKKKVIYVGENGGCCATANFFDLLHIEEYYTIPNWPGYDDGMYIGRFNAI